MAMHTTQDIRAWLIGDLARRLGIGIESIDPRDPFVHHGLDSHGALGMLLALGKALGRRLPLTLAWEYPTIEALATHLGGAPEATGERQRRGGTGSPLEGSPIAIVGIACRFPKAASPELFWRMLCDGIDAIEEVPQRRWNWTELYDPNASAVGKMNTRWGGFLDHVDRFDAQFFGIAPREAVQIDPQQRLMLELSWEALEDAGIPADGLRGSRGGVFFGSTWNDYAWVLGNRLDQIQLHTATGQNVSLIAGRVSYTLGLQGPSLVVNTACSSSLVAVHLACQSLRSGESTFALAGGVNLIMTPENTVALTKLGAMAPDGRSRAFDARASGFVRGEGGGVVVLKHLSRALADGDPIYCVIRGSAVNNDGLSNGLTAPNPQAQEAMLRDAYSHAGVEPAEVHYVEAHGTGTSLGDPIEARALGAVLGAGRAPDRPLRIGSLKTNIGHLESAAGIAGLIKAALAIKHRRLPPSLLFKEPNPHISFEELRLKIQQSTEPWPEDGRPPLAGVSSFGFSGTNCHVVVEGVQPAPVHLLPLSADDPEALQELVRSVRGLAAAESDCAALSYTCATRLSGAERRLGFTFRSREELIAQLDASLERRVVPGVATGHARRRRVVFMFGGQGSQWTGMGRDLLHEEPAFLAELDRCDRAMRPHLKWSLLDQLTSGHPSAESLDHCDIVQPSLFAMQVALAALWRSWGIEPDAVIGQSLGEIAAAYVAGILTLEDAASVVCRKSQLSRTAHVGGAMAAVELPWEEAERAIAAYGGRLTVAIRSAPRWSVLSGDTHALGEVLATLEERGVACRQVKVDYASHTPRMYALEAGFLDALRGVRPRRGAIPFYSTVTGSVAPGTDLDGTYWARTESVPVLFMQTVERLLADGHDLFIDVDPHPVLVHGVEQTAAQLERPATIVASIRRDERGRAGLLSALGVLYSRGCDVRWERVYPDAGAPLPLPFAGAAPERARAEPEPPALLVLSSHSAEALRQRAQDSIGQLKAAQRVPLGDICYTASVRRAHLAHRLAVVGSSRDALIGSLEAFLRGAPCQGMAHGHVAPDKRRKLVFVFPGQGSQWIGMGRQLLKRAPAFAGALAECDEAIRREVGWSLLEELWADGGPLRLERIDVVQPSLFAMAVALAALWRSWGVEPDAVVGHSMGEVAAAHVTGALSLTDAVKIVCRRSRLLHTVSGKGGMALVELPVEEVEQLLLGHGDRLSVGAINGPRTTVLSGDLAALDEVLARLGAKQVFCRMARTGVASHSPQMDPLTPELLEQLADIRPGATAAAMCSTVTGDIADGAALVAEYWVRNLRAPVLFARAVERLIETGHELFLEMSPHPLLLTPIEDMLRERGRGGLALPSLRRERDELQSLHESLGSLYTHGHPIDWKGVWPAAGRCVPMPTYPWQRRRYWLDDEPQGSPRRPRSRQIADHGHPLLGHPLHLSVQLGADVWENALSTNALPWLADHRVQREIVLPGAVYLAMAWAAAEQLYGPGAHALEDMTFDRRLSLAPGHERAVQTVVLRGEGGASPLHISSLEDGGESWLRHASGRLHRGSARAEARLADETPREIEERCRTSASSADHYRKMADAGLPYGPRFKGVSRLWYGDEEVLAQIHLPHDLASPVDAYRVHPALLDACFQTLISLVCTARAAPPPGGAFVLAGVKRAVLHRSALGPLWVHGRLTSCLGSAQPAFIGDLLIMHQEGELVAEIRGLSGRWLDSTAVAQAGREDELLFSLTWARRERAEHVDPPPQRASKGTWLLLVDKGPIGAAVSSLLRARGERCIEVRCGERYRRIGEDLHEVAPAAPESFRALLQGVVEPGVYRGVVHLWSLDATPPRDATSESLDADQDRGCVAALHLVQALSELRLRDAPPLWIVTRGAVAAGHHGAAVSVSQAPLRAFIRVLALEHPQIRCMSFDLDPQPETGEAEALLEELDTQEPEDQIARRKGERYVARLVRGAPAPEVRGRPSVPMREKAPRLPADATYLITGGLSGLGLVAARWLVSRGARHLALLGRSGPSEEAHRAIAEMAERGAQVTVASVDVSRRTQLAAVLDRIEATTAPLRGVIHAAGVLDDGTLLQMDAPQLRRVFAPKMHGAWNLHALTIDKKLDFFVLYSSVASLLGTAGQASYAAANAFMDALAHHRRSLGLCGMSINWGPFADVGLAARSDRRGARLAYRGMESLTPEQGMAALERLLDSDLPQIGVLRLDVRRWLEFHPGAAASALWSELLLKDPAHEREAESGASDLREALTRSPEQARPAMLERHLGEQVARVLRLHVESLDRDAPFIELGMDSLMSLELRNGIESSLGVRLSSTLLFTYPCIAALARHLCEALGLTAEPGEPAVDAATESAPGELRRHVDSMNKDELFAFIDSTLKNL